MPDVQDAIDRIPPEAWPFIDILFRITIALVAVWLVLALVALWRRRAYNLTVASTAGKSRKAQPDFLKVDDDARDDAIRRGERHEKLLDDRDKEEALAALRAAKDPLTLGARLAGWAAAAMSVFTLLTAVVGVVGNVGRMGDMVSQMSSAERLEYLVTTYPISSLVVVLVVIYSVYRYFADRQWKEKEE
jgi:hypothetical protein